MERQKQMIKKTIDTKIKKEMERIQQYLTDINRQLKKIYGVANARQRIIKEL